MAAGNSGENVMSYGNEIYSNSNGEDQDIYEDADPPPGPPPRYVQHPTKLGQENTQQPKSSSQQHSQACQSAGLLQMAEPGSRPKQRTKTWNGRWKCTIILLIVGFCILSVGSAMGLLSFIGTGKGSLCQRTGNISGGTISTTGQSTGDVAVYTCLSGYNMVGDSVRKCQHNGQWSAAEPNCTAQPSCVSLTHIAGGTVSVTGLKSGDVAVYTCSTGYHLVGLNVRKCQDNGEWSAFQPTCTPAATSCSSLSDISHGGVTVTGRAGGDVAVYTCSSGYTLVGTNVRKCQKTGRWSGSTPTCRTIAATCSSLSNISKGKVSVTGQATGDIAVYTCLPGYNLVGVNARKCQDNGQWSGSVPSCTATVTKGIAIRLVPESWMSYAGRKGRLMVQYGGVWGSVCDDDFSTTDGKVACKQLGFAGVSDVSTHGESRIVFTGKIWLDDVACSGSENSLFDCGHPGWGTHNCEHKEDVVLKCY